MNRSSMFPRVGVGGHKNGLTSILCKHNTNFTDNLPFTNMCNGSSSTSVTTFTPVKESVKFTMAQQKQWKCKEYESKETTRFLEDSAQ